MEALATEENHILIVDDEESVRSTIKDVLSDEGFKIDTAENGQIALDKIRAAQPCLVILDIWMPEMDGMAALQTIRKEYPNLPVIMISGHATISTAVKATQLGAVDFIEKPLDLETTVAAVKRALQNGCNNGEEYNLVSLEESGQETKPCQITPVVFREQKFQGAARPQKTLANSSLLYGVGVHSGQKSGLILEPLPENSGIHFAGVTSSEAVPAHVSYVETTGFATTIKSGDSQVSTIEHLLSALHAYGITNLLVKCNDEVPVMDGSSEQFCKSIEDIGIVEQDAQVYEIAIDQEYSVGQGEEIIKIEPADSFIIDYTLKYPEPVGTQRMVFELKDVEKYKSEIAPARTFGFVKDIAYLQKQGLAQGGRFNNFVLIGDDGAINGELRFPDEQVRHKILDAIGDLYLLGRPIKGKVTACMTGHSDNVELLRQIIAKL